MYESSAYLYDRVLFTRNSRGRHGYGVNNGTLGTVTAISPFTPEMTVLLDHGGRFGSTSQKFPHIRLGYAMTTYKAQGASIPKVWPSSAANSRTSLPRTSRRPEPSKTPSSTPPGTCSNPISAT